MSLLASKDTFYKLPSCRWTRSVSICPSESGPGDDCCPTCKCYLVQIARSATLGDRPKPNLENDLSTPCACKEVVLASSESLSAFAPAFQSPCLAYVGKIGSSTSWRRQASFPYLLRRSRVSNGTRFDNFRPPPEMTTGGFLLVLVGTFALALQTNVPDFGAKRHILRSGPRTNSRLWISIVDFGYEWGFIYLRTVV